MQESAEIPEQLPDTGPAGVSSAAAADRSKILYVIPSLDVGGSERHLAQIVPRLRDLGEDPSIYCLYRRGTLADAVQQSGVDVISPPVERDPTAGSSIHGFIAHLATVSKLLWILLARRPRVVHFFLPRAYIIGAPLALISRVPIRLMSRRSQNLYQDNWTGVRGLERRLHKHMTALSGNSQAVVDELIEQEGCDPEKVRLIYNGVDTDRYANPGNRAELRNQLEIPDRAFVAIIVANLIAYKGHDDLLKALASVRDRLPEPWVLLCVGRDDGPLAKLQALARKLGIVESIRFLGARDDVPELLAASDLGILCSHQEGFSNAILEGMAAGLPMVVTDVGGNAEAVVNGETGLVVPPRDPAALGEAIVQIACYPSRARAMGATGKRRAENLFGMDRCVQAYDMLYRDLLQDAGSQTRSVLARSAEAPTEQLDRSAPAVPDLITDFYEKYGSAQDPLETETASAPVATQLAEPDRAVTGPMVSVVIPVYNQAAVVHRAIQSVLAQSYENFELIVVDDGSNDGLMDALLPIADPRLELISHRENKGAAAARNTGVSKARGRYIAFLDADDCWLPNKLARQVEFMMSSGSELRMSCTGYEIISPYHPEGEIRVGPALLTESDLLAGCRVSPGTTLMAEKKLFSEVGPMNNGLPRLEDWDWLLRASRISDLAVLDDVLSIVDYSSAEKIDYRSAKKSVQVMRRLHIDWGSRLPRAARRRFAATLENELAAAAYRNRKYGLAGWHLFNSLLCWPYRSSEYFRRLASAVFVDARRFIRRHRRTGTRPSG